MDSASGHVRRPFFRSMKFLRRRPVWSFIQLVFIIVICFPGISFRKASAWSQSMMPLSHRLAFVGSSRLVVQKLSTQAPLQPRNYLPWSHTRYLMSNRFFSKSRTRNKKNTVNIEGEEQSDKGQEEPWIVPDYIPIPTDHLDLKFVRSSGAGGQNVNKVNTQVQARIYLPNAYWIPQEVKQRLETLQSSNINKEGYWQVSSQQFRTQIANRQDVMEKLQEALKAAWTRPKERKQKTGISKKTKEQRKEFKRRRGLVKERRRPVDF